MEPNKDTSLDAVALFSKYAKAYMDKFMVVNLYEDSLNAFCNLIAKENSNILEVACGPGNISRYLLNKKPALDIFGIDLAPNMVLLAQQNNPGSSFEVMDCRSIANLTQKFDAVICAFCLPYLSKKETNKLFSDINGLLNDEGICYISTMEDDYEKSGYQTSSQGDQVYLRYYNGDYIINALEKYNFSIVEIFRTSSIMSNGKEVVDLAIISRKKRN